MARSLTRSVIATTIAITRLRTWSGCATADWWEVVSSPRITSTPRSDTTPEQTRDARARAWAYVFECFYRRAGKEDNSDDQEQFVNKERSPT